ncbi:MAG: biopolymer transporter ExbD [Acidobacteria bacterium]|nr:biopolymer transporter ExbD [Acidobacteriota bacterium]
MRIEVRKIGAAIPTASMADIAFLLIIFFMLTTSFSPVKKSVDLPESDIRTEVQKDPAIIALDEDGSMAYSDGIEPELQVDSMAQLGDLVRSTVAANPQKQFVLRASRNARYQLIDQVLEQLRSNGGRNIGLLTEQRGGLLK